MNPQAVYLVQTDTTVGFLSQSRERLLHVKQRPPEKPFLRVFASCGDFKQQMRLPNLHKNRFRRSRATTYVIKNEACRLVSHPQHTRFLEPFGWCYSTSANASGSSYDAAFAHTHADVIVEDERGLFEAEPSRIYRINHKRRVRLR